MDLTLCKKWWIVDMAMAPTNFLNRLFDLGSILAAAQGEDFVDKD